MDEHKLAELFRDAVRDTPPSSFDEGDVRSASRRVTARRRTQLALGSTMAAVLLVGGAVVATGLIARPDSATTSAAKGDNTVMQAPAEVDRSDTSLNKELPGGVPTQGGTPPWSVGASAGTSAPQGCGTVDRELADALAVELSVPAGQEAVPVGIACPADSRAAAFVVDGEKIAAIVTPRGAAMQYEANTKFTQVPTASGLTLHVFAEPADGQAADRVQAIAGALIGQF
ncbi:hypothetical protein FKR81_08225 [Lentzea tibetensis]|uniref:Uncharacterized protein n=1 Tax=Lentzea tibetensis TaxID=2591470 RepID=A0A563EZA7_9PSEU|nr:hypothetical protein [Lentzea tibetensis]TWP53060.1 hypothetical protein FKR81_08225 [Lentzea tibetensis]